MKDRTTSRDFEIFKREAELWIGRLGLTDWSVDFFHSDNPDGRPCRAWFRGEIEGRFCLIGLSPDWSGIKITDEAVRKSAFHEVCEVMLMPLAWVAECRYAREEEIPEATHTIIRRFENLFYGKKGLK